MNVHQCVHVCFSHRKKKDEPYLNQSAEVCVSPISIYLVTSIHYNLCSLKRNSSHLTELINTAVQRNL